MEHGRLFLLKEGCSVSVVYAGHRLSAWKHSHLPLFHSLKCSREAWSFLPGYLSPLLEMITTITNIYEEFHVCQALFTTVNMPCFLYSSQQELWTLSLRLRDYVSNERKNLGTSGFPDDFQVLLLSGWCWFHSHSLNLIPLFPPHLA